MKDCYNCHFGTVIERELPAMGPQPHPPGPQYVRCALHETSTLGHLVEREILGSSFDCENWAPVQPDIDSPYDHFP